MIGEQLSFLELSKTNLPCCSARVSQHMKNQQELMPPRKQTRYYTRYFQMQLNIAQLWIHNFCCKAIYIGKHKSQINML